MAFGLTQTQKRKIRTGYKPKPRPTKISAFGAHVTIPAKGYTKPYAPPGYKVPTSGILRRAGITHITTPYATPAGRLTALIGATQGAKLPPNSKSLGPLVRRTSKRLAHEYVKQSEPLKEDPLAELAIDTIATAGVGGVARLGLAARDVAAARAAARAAGAATDTSAATDLAGALRATRAERLATRAAQRAERGKGLRRVVTAPKRATQAARTAPADVRALGTQAGRRAAARAVAKGVSPRVYGSPSYVVGAAGAQKATGKSAPGAAIPQGFVQAARHPGQTGYTTLRGIIGGVTYPVALGAAGLHAATTGDTRELGMTAKAGTSGVADILSHTLSSDPAVVQRAFQKEGAAALFTGIPALGRLGKVKTLKEKIASGAPIPESVRSGLRKIPVAGTHSHLRRAVAKIFDRPVRAHGLAGHQHAKNIAFAASRAHKAHAGAAEVIPMLLQSGVRDARTLGQVRHWAERRGLIGEVPTTGEVNARVAFDYAREHPGIFQNKPFQEALSHSEKASGSNPLAQHGMGEAARVSWQGQLFGHTPPENMVPEAARAHTKAATREQAWSEYHARTKDIAELHKLARANEMRAHGAGEQGPKGFQGPTGITPAAAELHQEAGVARDMAHRLEAHNAALGHALDPYTRPGAKDLTNAVRQPYDAALSKEYVQKVEAARKEMNLAPAFWVHHEPIGRAERGLGQAESHFPRSTPGYKVRHKGEGSLASRDEANLGFAAFLHGTVMQPRLRQGLREAVQGMVKRGRPFTYDGKRGNLVPSVDVWRDISTPKSDRNPNGGQVNPKEFGFLPLRDFNQAVHDPTLRAREPGDLNSALANPDRGLADFVKVLDATLHNRSKGKMPGIILHRSEIAEMRDQVQPSQGHLSSAANAVGHFGSRLLLGLNPAWLGTQTIAELIPELAAHPELIGKAPGIVKDLKAFAHSDLEHASYLQGFAGAAIGPAGRLRTPRELHENPFPTREQMGRETAALTKGKARRVASGIGHIEIGGTIDVARQNWYRSVLLVAEADKRFGKNFANRQEMLGWLTSTTKGREELNKLADYVDNVQGNWTSFTARERSFYPLAIFPGFLRYSVKWPFTMARQHPVAATTLFLTGQANANELEKLLGRKPSNSLAYAYPVLTHPPDPKAYAQLIAAGLSPKRAKTIASMDILPAGTRFSPTQSAFTGVALSGNTAQAIGSSNPGLQMLYTGLSGKGSFGEDVKGSPWGAAALEGLNLIPPLRVGAQLIPAVHRAEEKIGLTQAPSLYSEAFRRLDPKRGFRSLAAPWLSQSGVKAYFSNQLQQALSDASANSRTAQNAETDPRKIAQMKLKEQKASQTIDGVLKVVGLLGRSRRESAKWLAAHGYSSGGSGPDTSGVFGGSSGSSVDLSGVFGQSSSTTDLSGVFGK